MTLDELPSLMADLRADGTVAARATEFLALTTARRGEVLGATRDEVALDAAVWRIDGDRRKIRVVHEIPLCARAVEILRDRAAESSGPLLFGDAQGKAPHERSLDRALRRLGRERVTPHSFRSLFLDWSRRDGVPEGAATAALGRPGDGEAERLRARRELMERWAAFCLSGRAASPPTAEPA